MSVDILRLYKFIIYHLPPIADTKEDIHDDKFGDI